MKERIFEATGKFLKLKGIKKFRMDDIAHELNISKKTIYKYFPSKEDLVKEYLEDSLSGIEERTVDMIRDSPTLREKLKVSILLYKKHIVPINCLEEIRYTYPSFYLRFYEAVQFKYKLWNDLLIEGIKTGEIRSTIDVKFLQYVSNLVLTDLATTMYTYKNNVFFNDAINQFIDIVFDGIFVNHETEEGRIP